MLGFLPPSSRATFLTVGGRGGHQHPAGLQAAGEGDQVDPRVGGQRGPGLRSRAEHQVADARREPGLLEEPHQVDASVRGQLAGLEHEGVAGGQARRDLPGGLEERVVPRRDQAAHADRLVHHAADHVGVAGVDDPAGVLRGDPPVVAEHGHHVGDVVVALDQPLAGVQGLGPRHGVGVALEQVGDAEQQVAALAGRRRRPGAVVEGVVRRGDGAPRCPPGRPRRRPPPGCRRRGTRWSGWRQRARSSTHHRRRDPALALPPQLRRGPSHALRCAQRIACSATSRWGQNR